MKLPIIIQIINNPYFSSPGPPGPVRLLKATEIGYTHVKLSWQPPADEGGSKLTGYRVQKGYQFVQWTNGTEYLFTGLGEGMQYRFCVVAENAWGSYRTINRLTVSTKQATSKPFNDYCCYHHHPLVIFHKDNDHIDLLSC